MGIEDIYWITPEFSVIVAGVVGLLVGSFLNVVIHRLPLMMQAQWEAELEEALAQQNPAAAEAAPQSRRSPPSTCWYRARAARTAATRSPPWKTSRYCRGSSCAVPAANAASPFPCATRWWNC